MDVTAMAKTDYNLNISLSEDELNQILDEIEVIFVRYAREGKLEEIQRLTEFKNLLTMSINNL